ncbi:MAG: class I SAM-dependent methyltransferase [Myxococcota bacterium]
MRNEADPRPEPEPAEGEGIAPTAHYTAYAWYRLGFPYGFVFVTPEGRRAFWSVRVAGEWVPAVMPQLPSMLDYLELRHALIEDAVEREHPDVLLELAAGLSRRGIYWARERGVRVVEADLAPMIARKRTQLALHGVDSDKLRLVTRDLLEPGLEDFVHDVVREAERPVVVAEGFLGYLAESERSIIVASVAEALRRRGGGLFLCDLRMRRGGVANALSGAIRLGILAVTRGRSAKPDFESQAAAESFLCAAGFDEVQVLTPSLIPRLAHLETPNRVFACRVS